MQRRIYQILSFSAPYYCLGAITYLLASQKLTLNAIEIVNFSFFILQILLMLPFVVLFTFRFKQHHQQLLREINSRIHVYARGAVFVVSICFCVFSYTIIFYQYFVKLRSQAGMWSIQLNVFMSIMVYIFYARALMLEITTTMFKYTVYIIMTLIVMIFLAHLSVMTMKPIYLPELCLEIAILLILVDCWWVKTPALLQVLMIAADVISIEELARSLVMKPPPKEVLGIRIVLIVIVAVHLCFKIWQLIKQMKRCIGEFYEDESKDVPLSNVMISQIPLVQFKKIQINQQNKNNDKEFMEESMNDILDTNICAICTMKIEENSLIYDIPCKHVFHDGCLGRWLQVRNSCPTCRNPAI